MSNIRKKKPRLIFHSIIIIFIFTIIILYKPIYNSSIDIYDNIRYFVKLTINEFFKNEVTQNEVKYLYYTNRVYDKNIFDLFHFIKKDKERLITQNKLYNYDENILELKPINSISSMITYNFNNEDKRKIQINSIILLPGEAIKCECKNLLESKILIFDNKGVNANKINSQNTLTVIYENNQIDTFNIKNNQSNKIIIPENRPGKNLTFVWNKSSAGFLVFHGIEKKYNYNDQKTVFISIKSDNFSDIFFNKLEEKFKNENIFINRNSFPLSTNYSHNIKSLEAFSLPLNIGNTYNSNDLFKEKEKNFLDLVNSNYKDLLRINIFSESNQSKIINYGNSTIKINRENSISNISSIVGNILKNSRADIFRIDIQLENKTNENDVLNIINEINSIYNIFILIGNNYDFYKNTPKTSQSLIFILPNEFQKSFIRTIKKIYKNKIIQHNIITDILKKIIKNNGDSWEDLNTPDAISIHSDNEDFFIFNNNYFISNKKFSIPFNEIKKYQNIIEDKRSKYQIRDLFFTFYNTKSSKIKLYSKDKILRCFSNFSIDFSQFNYDAKQEYYSAEIKILSKDNIDELNINCLLYSDNFHNEYKIEAQKDEKQLNKMQIGLGEYLINPSQNSIINNSISIKDYIDFTFLYTQNKPKIDYKKLNYDLIICSHYFPYLDKNLKFLATYNEKKLINEATPSQLSR